MLSDDVTQPTRPTTPINSTKNKNRMDHSRANLADSVCWEAIGGVPIPFIKRGDRKLTEKCIIEKTLLKKYEPFFSDEVFECIKARAVSVWESELQVLNGLNALCNSIFTRRPYAMGDRLIGVREVTRVHRFLKHCYEMLVLLREDENQCGFFSVDNSETLIPFVVVDSRKYVPLFYFEGQHYTLNSHVVDLTDPWKLAYVKICCKMQQVSRILYAKDSIKVIDTSDLIHMFPEDARFKIRWPEFFDCNLIRRKDGSSSNDSEPTLDTLLMDYESYKDECSLPEKRSPEIIEVSDEDEATGDDMDFKGSGSLLDQFLFPNLPFDYFGETFDDLTPSYGLIDESDCVSDTVTETVVIVHDDDGGDDMCESAEVICV